MRLNKTYPFSQVLVEMDSRLIVDKKKKNAKYVQDCECVYYYKTSSKLAYFRV